MITAITCSMVKSPITSGDDYMNTYVTKSKGLESIMKHLMK